MKRTTDGPAPHSRPRRNPPGACSWTACPSTFHRLPDVTTGTGSRIPTLLRHPSDTDSAHPLYRQNRHVAMMRRVLTIAFSCGVMRGRGT